MVRVKIHYPNISICLVSRLDVFRLLLLSFVTIYCLVLPKVTIFFSVFSYLHFFFLSLWSQYSFMHFFTSYLIRRMTPFTLLSFTSPGLRPRKYLISSMFLPTSELRGNFTISPVLYLSFSSVSLIVSNKDPRTGVLKFTTYRKFLMNTFVTSLSYIVSLVFKSRCFLLSVLTDL